MQIVFVGGSLHGQTREIEVNAEGWPRPFFKHIPPGQIETHISNTDGPVNLTLETETYCLQVRRIELPEPSYFASPDYRALWHRNPPYVAGVYYELADPPSSTQRNTDAPSTYAPSNRPTDARSR